MSRDPARDWIAANHPDELVDFPYPETGRHAREVSMDSIEDFETVKDVPYWERVPSHPGGHVNSAWRRNEAIASQQDELIRHAVGQPCTHCHDRPIKYSGPGLCDTCSAYIRRHGGSPRPVNVI